ncbi:MAG: fructose-1,6-bisphosphatase [Porphyromonadaceae bacterium]|nr:fructose-1,6-bisphosphatase [Porphyromonadaceae bacterium]
MEKRPPITPELVRNDLRYLQLLSTKFPTISDACIEIINLDAILNLPKGTEHFLTDLHGEYEAFLHVLKNASGTVRRKVEEIFGQTLRENEVKELCTLIYYPEQKLALVKKTERDMSDWYRITIHQLISVSQNVSSKYTRSKVQKALPPEFSYILQELLHESQIDPNKQAYVNGIISSIISTGRADACICAICNLIQRLVIDTLHIVGDIFDRGPGAEIIMDKLCSYHNVDIQWGNHDILWIGAAAGNDCCIANVLRLSMRYGNHSTLEDGYGINMVPLATFAIEHYSDDPCTYFVPKGFEGEFNEKTRRLLAQMHKAIAVIQFKLESQMILAHPDFNMNDRLLLDKIDYERGVLILDGKEYPLRDRNLPTVDPVHPFALSPEEEELMGRLHTSFVNSEKLRKHMRCLFSHGSMYLVRNNNLLYHASIPLNDDGSFREVLIEGKPYKGKALLDKIDQLIRIAYFAEESAEKKYALDYVWYLWCGEDAPSFGKDKMATFERYFTDDKELWKETKSAYYTLFNEKSVCEMILQEFGLTDPNAHIINGHVPVKRLKGENPVKAGGKMLVIDGGFSKAYQPETGTAGYTLIFHSRGLQLVQHEPFESTQKAIEDGIDIISTNILLELSQQRMRVRDTDKGKELEGQIYDLKKLLVAYRNGFIKEKQ